MKTCTKCGESKPPEAFQSSKRTRDGRTPDCKKCINAYRRAYMKAYRATPNGQAVTKAGQQRYRSTPKGKAVHRAHAESWRLRNPRKAKAHEVLRTEVRAGRITPEPCEVCGAEAAEAHHDNYDKPLAVRWLCGLHHREWHATHGEAA